MKSILSIFSAIVLSISTFGQGQVMFNNLDRGVVPNIDARVYDVKDGIYAYGTRVQAALLGGPVGSQPAIVDFGNYSYSPGTLSMLANPVDGRTWVNFLTGPDAGYVDVGSSGARIVSNVGYNQPVMLQVVAWTGNYPNWIEALYSSALFHNTEIGCSAPWIVTTTKDATDTAFAHNVGLMEFYIATPPIPEIPFGVPEPSMLSLMVLGFAILLLRARRK